jgi:hypothetical protein
MRTKKQKENTPCQQTDRILHLDKDSTDKRINK